MGQRCTAPLVERTPSLPRREPGDLAHTELLRDSARLLTHPPRHVGFLQHRDRATPRKRPATVVTHDSYSAVRAGPDSPPWLCDWLKNTGPLT